MSTSITPSLIRQTNRLQIYHLIYTKRLVSQRELCEELHLSRPTVASCLASLEEDGLIRTAGAVTSGQVGRKAVGYQICSDHAWALGVEIRPHEMHLLSLNLYGEVVHEKFQVLEYQNNDTILGEIARQIQLFIDENQILKPRILGIGLAFPGVVSPDGRSVLYGDLSGNTGLVISELPGSLNTPCSLLSSADCDAVYEMSVNPELTNAFYLSLSDQVSGALISGRVISPGLHGHSGDIAHLPVNSFGKTCRCGRTGCLETTCNTEAFLPRGETLSEFFEKLRSHSPGHVSRWEHYLSGLARAIYLLHLVYDTRFILGGKIGINLIEDDLTILYQKIDEWMLYPEEHDYLMVSRVPSDRTAAGAALPYIWSYLGREDL